MDVVKVSLLLEAVFFGLFVLVIIIGFIRRRKLGFIEGVTYLVMSVSLSTLFISGFTRILGSNYLYVCETETNPLNGGYGNINISRDELNKIGITDEVLSESYPLDRIEIRIKEDTSDVSIEDIILCRNEKWLEGKVNHCTDYALVKGKDIKVVVEDYLKTRSYAGGRNWYRHVGGIFLEYKGCLYKIKVDSIEIVDDTTYLLMWDSLSKEDISIEDETREGYTVCTLSEYNP